MLFENLSWNIKLLRCFKEKHSSIFIITILGWFQNLFRTFVTWSLVAIVLEGYFQVWNYIKKKLIKNLYCCLHGWNWSSRVQGRPTNYVLAVKLIFLIKMQQKPPDNVQPAVKKIHLPLYYLQSEFTCSL